MKIIYQVEVDVPDDALAIDWKRLLGVFQLFRKKGWHVRCKIGLNGHNPFQDPEFTTRFEKAVNEATN